jgi:hypothetical protein
MLSGKVASDLLLEDNPVTLTQTVGVSK